MAKTTICLGVVLILFGILGFVSNGNHDLTTLIPAAIGFLLSILGMFALTDNAKKRMLYMHIAVTIGLLGFLGTGWNIVKYFEFVRGTQLPYPVLIEVEEMAATAGILLLFVLLCVRSFIVARRVKT